MINTQLQDQLWAALKEKKIEVKYPDGYRQWKEKFDYFYNITKDVNQTLDCIYGPGNAGVNNYKGSIYVNSNLKLAELTKQKVQSKPHNDNCQAKPSSQSRPQSKSKAFDFLKLKEGNNANTLPW